VSSPTFTILNVYPGKIPVYHFDFYRLQDAADLENTGGQEFIPPADGIAIIEWAEKIPEVLPPDYLEITITADDQQRRRFRIESLSAQTTNPL
jgi:tRNA threonylcarbamoyladenosine biosynthesis protein TsaE